MSPDSSIDDLVDHSTIIFIGTVQKLGASNVPGHPATSHSVVVRVDRALRVPPALGDLTAQRITVELTGAPGVRVGQQATFFTNGLVYSDSIVVQEVARRDTPLDTVSRQAHVSEVSGALQRRPDRHLRRRLATADVVVTGKIASIGKPPRTPGSSVASPCGVRCASIRLARAVLTSRGRCSPSAMGIRSSRLSLGQVRAWVRAAASSMRSVGSDASIARVMPPSSSTSRM